MATEDLIVQGLTGVDMTLHIAGVGTRAYAFVIDWHIRLLLALGWLLLAWLLLRTGMDGASVSAARPILFGLAVVAPSLVLYFLYHPVLEVVMQGRTPGKRMAGARIVTREGATPSSGALLMRNLFRLIDSLPVFYVLGLGFCFFTAKQVRIGDLAAGTVLVLDESKSRSKSLERVAAHVEQASIDPRAATLIEDVLDRWAELAPQWRIELARSLLEKLDRNASTDQLRSLDEMQLRSRLQALLGRV